MMVSLRPETFYPLIDKPQCQIYVEEVHRYPLSSVENSQMPGEFWNFDESHREIYVKIHIRQKSIKNKK